MAPLPTQARIEIDCSTLTRLLASGSLHACELRCLDDSSRQLLRKLCLEACAQHCGRPCGKAPAR